MFNSIKQKLGGRVRLILSGAAPLAPQVQEFMAVAMCAPVLQVRPCGWDWNPPGTGTLTPVCRQSGSALASSLATHPFTQRLARTLGEAHCCTHILPWC